MQFSLDTKDDFQNHSSNGIQKQIYMIQKKKKIFIQKNFFLNKILINFLY